MVNFGENEDGITPIVGVFLLVAITVTMFAAIGFSVYIFESGQTSSTSGASQSIIKVAYIEVKEAKGGLFSVKFNENWIILYHKSGDSLSASQTKIQIEGYGETQDKAFGNEMKKFAKAGNILVEYINLEYSGKLEANPGKNNGDYSKDYHGYGFHNPELSDGSWSAGETLTLNGQDGINPSSGNASTVNVYMDGIDKTDNNWRFMKGGEITVTVLDATTDQVIATVKAIVM